MYGTSLRIVRKENIDDGTTGGKTIYYDQYGRIYENASSIDYERTGVTVYHVDSNGNIWSY